MGYMGRLDFPTTTSGIAMVVGLNWAAANQYLKILRREGRLHSYRVGKQTEWWTARVGAQRKEIRRIEKERDRMLAVIKCLLSAEKGVKEIMDETGLGSHELKQTIQELKRKGLLCEDKGRLKLVK